MGIVLEVFANWINLLTTSLALSIIKATRLEERSRASTVGLASVSEICEHL